MLKSSLCDYSDAQILVTRTISVSNTAGLGTISNNNNKEVIFKNCAPCPDCIGEINNTQVDNAKDIDVVMPTYNVIEYSNNYPKASGILWQYCKVELDLNTNNNIIDFNGANNTDLFNLKIKTTGQIGKVEQTTTKNVEIVVPLECLSNIWRIIEVPLINFKINLILTWSSSKYPNN